MNWVAFGAVATAAATIVALWFGLSAERRARKAEARLRDEHRARQLSEDEYQARRVSAWIISEVEDERIGTSSVLDIYIEVQNASAEPVWDVRGAVPQVDADDDGDEEHFEDIVFPIVPPGKTIRSRLKWTPPDDYAPVVLQFCDNRGRSWRRDRGALTMIANPISALREIATDGQAPGFHHNTQDARRSGSRAPKQL